MELEKPFMLDKNGLYYLDPKTKIEEIFINDFNKNSNNRVSFYKIDGIDNYIIKDCTLYPYFFNRLRNMNLLKELVKRQDQFDNIDFPVAYYERLKMLKGIVIPYYEEAITVRKLITFHYFGDLINYYCHDSNEMDNFICMLLDILTLIRIMYEKGIHYIDPNPGNFLVYNNIMKVIDFEPNYVFFDKNYDKHMQSTLRRFGEMVNYILLRFGFKNVVFYVGRDFSNTEKNILELRKRLER